MKIRLLTCQLALQVFAVLSLCGQPNLAQGQDSCGLDFSGPAGNELTSFIDVYPNYPNCDATFNAVVQSTNQPLPLGTYLTWCVDAGVQIDPSQGYTVPGTVYTGALFATCDTNLNNEVLPDHTATFYVSPAVWQQVNYLLNHKVGTNFWNIQVAINDLVGGPAPSAAGYPAFDPASVQAMVSAATNNAAAWAPQCGDVLGAVYEIQQQAGITLTNPVQYLMVEVPYCPITFTQCAGDLALGCNPSTIPNANVTNVTAVSCCGHPVTITATQSQATVGCSNWRYIVYTAADAYGNNASCTQTITWTTDTNAPVLLAAPASTNLGCNPSFIPNDASVKALVSYAESCSTATVSVTHVDGGTPCAMSRLFLISASDACGNQSLTNYVAYTWTVDTNAPVLKVVPGSTNLGCSYTSLPTDGSLAASVVAGDDCTVVSTNITHVDSTNGVNVTRTFTIKVADECGNVTATNVTYTWVINQGPLLACAADITISGTNDAPGVTGIPGLTDACGNPLICSNSITYTTNYLNLYCDQFSGTGGALNGRAPDSCDMGGFKWTSCPGWLACGNQAATTNCNGSAYLPFQPTPGYVYQVSADVECFGDNTADWLAFGFANSGNTACATLGNGLGWALVRNTGNTVYSDMWNCGTNRGWTGYYSTNITHCSILLDTRPANPAAWTCTYLANGNVIAPATAFGCNPNINIIGFGLNHSSSCGCAHVKNFCVCVGIPTIITNTALCANLSYKDTVTATACAGKVQISRKWYGWDNQGHTNSCTQNIYELLPLNPPTFAPSVTALCAPATLPTDANVKALVIAYGGLASTNVTHVDTTNGCVITRVFTVTVADSCGEVSPAATLVYTLSNPLPCVKVCVCGPANGTCSTACTYTCNVTNTGNAPFSSCTLNFLSQTFNCPALAPGQGCSFPVGYTFQTCDCGSFCRTAVATAVCATPCAPTCTGQGTCTTKVVACGCGPIANGTYKIINRNSGLALDVCGASTSNGAQIDQYGYKAAGNQKWTVTCQGDGSYKIVGVASGLSLDDSSSSSANGNKIQLWGCNGGANQAWILTPTCSGNYRIAPSCAPGSCLDVTGASTANSTVVQLWSANGGANQDWSFQAP